MILKITSVCSIGLISCKKHNGEVENNDLLWDHLYHYEKRHSTFEEHIQDGSEKQSLEKCTNLNSGFFVLSVL